MKTLLILTALIFSAAAWYLRRTSGRNMSKARSKTEELFARVMRKKNVHNAFLAVRSPTLSLDWRFVDGKFRDGEPVTDANPFLSASIGKTFTATAIAILTEQGKLNFEDKIKDYLPEDILKDLHVFHGHDYSGQITIAQLLQHTSGLPDYIEGETIDGSPNVLSLIFRDPARFWQPAELILFTKEKMKPNFPPGGGYRYTDTEYILLGLIIERISGAPLHECFREFFFEPLAMRNTSMHLRSEPAGKTGRTAEVYLGKREAGALISLSADWAGGGLRTTAADLIKFHVALNTGRLLSENTLQNMQQWISETKGMYYGFGLRKIVFRELFPLLPKLEIIGHSGITGSFMYYCPQLNVYLAGTLNQMEEVRNSVVLLVKILSQIKKQTPAG